MEATGFVDAASTRLAVVEDDRAHYCAPGVGIGCAGEPYLRGTAFAVAGLRAMLDLTLLHRVTNLRAPRSWHVRLIVSNEISAVER